MNFGHGGMSEYGLPSPLAVIGSLWSSAKAVVNDVNMSRFGGGAKKHRRDSQNADLDFYWEKRLNSAIVISEDEFRSRWSENPSGGSLSLSITRLPPDAAIRQHLENRGFRFVFQETEILRSGKEEEWLHFFSYDAGVVFLLQLCISVSDFQVRSAYKCESMRKGNEFIKRLDFQKLFGSVRAVRTV
mmetsp:Transcript_863/g.1046  ORF Transcript_863/g.1046 Transcript_863/m.1046 type:complete len:187 (+) Transcript_863:3-563(+)